MKKYHFLGQETWSKLRIFMFGSYTALRSENMGRSFDSSYDVFLTCCVQLLCPPQLSFWAKSLPHFQLGGLGSALPRSLVAGCVSRSRVALAASKTGNAMSGCECSHTP